MIECYIMEISIFKLEAKYEIYNFDDLASKYNLNERMQLIILVISNTWFRW